MIWTEEEQQRFWEKVQIGKEEECWNWTALKHGIGYGRFCSRKTRFFAHRVSWEMTTGEAVPEGKVIRHTCDNPACVNPGHLLLGTQVDNIKDKVARGRNNSAKVSGEGNGSAKLTDELVLELRQKYRDRPDDTSTSAFCRLWSQLWGYNESTLRRVVDGITWRHLIEEECEVK